MTASVRVRQFPARQPVRRALLLVSLGCPMSLDVHSMVLAGHMENDECILCGTCVDNCNLSAIRFTFTAGK